MIFIKLALVALLAVATRATPVGEAQSYSSYSSGGQESQDSLSLSHAPVVIASHAPVEAYHVPEVEHHAPAHYEFKYGVRDEHTHDIKEQAEKREGDRVTGYYKLVEPDGTTRTVHYTADKHTGFHAQVSRSGHAAHPSAPVHKVIAAPVISYSHEPLLAQSESSNHGSASSYSSISSSLGQQSQGYN